MVIKNLTKNTILAKDLKEAKTLLDKTLGLLKASNPRSLLFKTRFGIHTFLLKDPIDVIVLDNLCSHMSSGKVVKIGQNIRPNSLFFWNPRYNVVIELPKGTIQKTKIEVGDNILLEDCFVLA